MNEHDLSAALIGKAETIKRVEWEQPEQAWDSGYAFVLADALESGPELVPAEAVRNQCVACIARQWPYVQAGMAVAFEHGAAQLGHDGAWHPA